MYDSVKYYLAHVIEQPNLRIPNPQYLQLLFTEISVVWITEISVVWVKEISVASRTTGIYLWP